jgi:hypothetical protein
VIVLTVDNNDARRTEIVARVNNLNKKISNPEAYHIGTTKIREFEEERKKLLEEYNHLPPETKYCGKITLEEHVTYEGAIPIKRDQYGRLFCPEDSQIAGIHTKIIADEQKRPIKAVRYVRNSDTRGRPEKRVYDIVINPMKPSPPETPMQQTATKKEEGKESTKISNDEYMQRIGFVKDLHTGRWRRPTPQEYCKMRDKERQLENSSQQKTKDRGFSRNSKKRIPILPNTNVK